MNYQIEMQVNGEYIQTLRDILPDKGPLKLLFIGKRPSPESVSIGHYFRGKQGLVFWNRLREYDILDFNDDEYPDDRLLEHNYGITDLVKLPGYYREEPTDLEYRRGISDVLQIIDTYKPQVVVFVYKKVIDKILQLHLGINRKTVYGFNPDLKERFYNTNIYVFPMHGTPCTSINAHIFLTELKHFLMNYDGKL